MARFTAANPYRGPTHIVAGTLLIDGVQTGVMNMTGGTSGGVGRAGPIFGGAAGTIAPGHSPDILSSEDIVLAARITFAPELNGTTAGAGYDQLKVAEAVVLANATLAPVIAPNVTLPLDATLTIIDNDVAA